MKRLTSVLAVLALVVAVNAFAQDTTPPASTTPPATKSMKKHVAKKRARKHTHKKMMAKKVMTPAPAATDKK